MLRFFPNDVASFEPVVALLVHLDDVERQQRQEGGAPRLEDGQGLWEAQARPLHGLVPPRHLNPCCVAAASGPHPLLWLPGHGLALLTPGDKALCCRSTCSCCGCPCWC